MKFARTSEDSDVLTTVLNTLQFKGQVFCYSRFTAPWALKLPAGDFAHFHVCESGHGWIKVEGSESPIPLRSGDLVIVPHGTAHVFSDDPKSKAIAFDTLLRRRPAKDHIVRHGAAVQKQSLSAARSNSRMRLAIQLSRSFPN